MRVGWMTVTREVVTTRDLTAGGWANDEDVQFVKEQVKVFFAEST